MFPPFLFCFPLLHCLSGLLRTLVMIQASIMSSSFWKPHVFIWLAPGVSLLCQYRRYVMFFAFNTKLALCFAYVICDTFCKKSAYMILLVRQSVLLAADCSSCFHRIFEHGHEWFHNICSLVHYTCKFSELVRHVSIQRRHIHANQKVIACLWEIVYFS